MEMTIIYIILIIILLRILWRIFCNLMVVFHQSTADFYVKKVMENPYKYVKDEEMYHFTKNMMYLLFISLLLCTTCKGNIKFEKKTNPTEISNMKNK